MKYKNLLLINKNFINVISLSLITCCLFSNVLWSSRDDHNLNSETPPPAGYAKIRIWNSAFEQGIAGHVSLQTRGDENNPAGTYLSLWPNSDGGGVRYSGEVTTKLRGNSEYILDAPAICMTSYNQDFQNEDNKDPNHIFIIKLNTEKINKIAVESLNNGTYKYSDDEETLILNDNFRWYAPGVSDIFSQNLDSSKTYLNCASSVMLALILGEVESNHIKPVIDEKNFTSEFMKSLGNVVQEHTDNLHLLSELSKIILPRDIEKILKRKTGSFFEQQLITELNRKTIQGIKSDDNISISQIVTYLSSDLTDENKNIVDIFKQKGWLPYFPDYNLLVLPQALKDKIQQKKNLKDVGEAVMIATGFVGGAYIISEVAKKNKCIIM